MVTSRWVPAARAGALPILLALAFAPGLAGCGGPAEGTRDVSSVLGPWLAQPLASIDRTLAAAAERVCRTSASPVRGDAVAVLHDQRGMGIDTAIFVGPSGPEWCQVLSDKTGLVRWQGGASSGQPTQPILPPVAIVIDSWGSSSSEAGGSRSDVSEIDGRVVDGVERVTIVLADGASVSASVAGGWFYAWWPSKVAPTSVVAAGAAGQPLGTATP